MSEQPYPDSPWTASEQATYERAAALRTAEARVVEAAIAETRAEETSALVLDDATRERRRAVAALRALRAESQDGGAGGEKP